MAAGIAVLTARRLQVDLRLRRMSDAAFTPSVPIPSLQTSASGMALSMGVFSNLRYQLVGGIDRYLFDHAEHLWPYLAASSAFRGVSTIYGNETRLHFQVRACLPPRRCAAPCAFCSMAPGSAGSACPGVSGLMTEGVPRCCVWQLLPVAASF